jgi:hypothetical protein
MRGIRRRPLMRTAMIGGAGVMAGRAAAKRSQQADEHEERLAGPEAQQAARPARPLRCRTLSSPSPAGKTTL